MNPNEYKARAEHYRRAKEQAKDGFTRSNLEAMERSYLILAESEEALRKSSTLANALSRRCEGQGAISADRLFRRGPIQAKRAGE